MCQQRAKKLQNVNHPTTRLADRSPTASPDQIFDNDGLRACMQPPAYEAS
jgi:hypothetical protein